MRRVMLAVGVIAFVAAGSSACATKKFVRTNVGEVNEKVDTLTRNVEETQERTRQNEARIGEVDTKVGEVDTRVTTVAAGVDKVNARTEAIERASRRLVYEVVLSEDQGNFQFGKTDLPETAVPELDRLVDQLKADPQGVFIEIEGHTDAVGPKTVNHQIGLQRAESVKRYLYEQHQVPLHKMSVISYGEEKPIAPNNTRDGRAQNRRVVIKVLS